MARDIVVLWTYSFLRWRSTCHQSMAFSYPTYYEPLCRISFPTCPNFKREISLWEAPFSSIHEFPMEPITNDPPCHFDLTILIPAYNEKNRIGDTLSTYVNCLRNSQVYPNSHQRDLGGSKTGHTSKYTENTGSVSILVVDDGSTDGTADFVTGKTWLNVTGKNDTSSNMTTLTNESRCPTFWQVDDNVRCISLMKNQGKGAAIERGMNQLYSLDPSIHCLVTETSLRKITLISDADGSGDISRINHMIHELELLLRSSNGKDFNLKIGSTQQSMTNLPLALVVGYRVKDDESKLRSILSLGFRATVSIIFLGASLKVRDTQCGFKLMTTSTGKILYNKLNSRRWTHDVEVIHRARLIGVPIGECKVPWSDKPGSKLITSWLSAIIMSSVMLKEVASLRVLYALRKWRGEYLDLD